MPIRRKRENRVTKKKKMETEERKGKEKQVHRGGHGVHHAMRVSAAVSQEPHWEQHMH